MNNIRIAHYGGEWHVYLVDTNMPIYSHLLYEEAYNWAKEYVAEHNLSFAPVL